MSKPDKSTAFLQALATPAPAAAAPQPKLVEVKKVAPPKPRTATRDGLKHIGGYFGRDDVEKFAILRARLGLDNSELIKLAIDELFNKNKAKRAFGDE